jgi:uncharacterized protein (TIGR02453 family)
MTFAGFSDAALEFYLGLEADNTKPYWEAHKATWEAEVRDPMRALVGELEAEFGPAKLFRPYRDVRFSKDKSPYKTHQGAFVGETTGVGWYVQVSKDGLLAGGGWRSHGADEVQRYRAGVDDDRRGPELERIMAALRGDGFDVHGDELVRAPRGYAQDHPRLDLLRCRSLMVLRELGAPDWLATPRALDEVRTTWRAVRPLAEWVSTVVGAA